MGNSSASEQQPQITYTPPPESLPLPNKPLVENIQDQPEPQHPQPTIFQDPNQARLRLNKKSSTEIKPNPGKIRRELPPLKKIRSVKKIADKPLEARQNLGTNQNWLNVNHMANQFCKGDAKTSGRQVEVEQIFEENDKSISKNENAFRQTRTRKLRLTKQIENKFGAYF